jgi:hypothetical protein
MTVRFLPLTEVDNRCQLADMTYPVYRPLLLPAGLDQVPAMSVTPDFPCRHFSPALLNRSASCEGESNPRKAFRPSPRI